jgi:hypothetical protein
MKLSDQMLFGHPILSSGSNDYHDSLFAAEFDINIEDPDWLIITATINLQCSDLDTLLEEGGAGCGFYVICRETYQNRLIEMTPGRASHKLNAHHFFGTIQLRPVVWSTESRTGWTSKYLHPEYGGRVDFPAAAILAVGDESRFSIDRERLRPFESIFALAANDGLQRGEMAVDPERDKITIFVHPETKDSVDSIRNDPRGRTVLLNALYLPALMQVLSEVAQRGNTFENKAWYRIFSAKCGASGINPESGELLQNAQRLLKYPFARIEDQKERLFS